MQTGDKVCIHSIKDLHFRGRALKVQAVLVTPDAIKDILFNPGKDMGMQNMISESTLKKLIIKGFWRYSYINLGQYIKVDVEPQSTSFGGSQGNNSRPVILRIVWIEHDGEPTDPPND